jgi:hypothetical protein
VHRATLAAGLLPGGFFRCALRIPLDYVFPLSDECVWKESKMTPTKQSQRTITETTDLGIGLLIAESEDGDYQPIGAVMTIREAREIAANDIRRRMHRLEQGSDPMCPARYLVWAQGDGGEYSTVAEIEA